MSFTRLCLTFDFTLSYLGNTLREVDRYPHLQKLFTAFSFASYAVSLVNQTPVSRKPRPLTFLTTTHVSSVLLGLAQMSSLQ